MKKLSLLTVFALLLFCSSSFAQVAVRENGGGQIGVAGGIDLACDPNSTITDDGFTYRVGCNANFVTAGIANGGSTSMTTVTLVVPTSYSLVRKAIAAAAAGAFSAGTLANGVPGQVLTMVITAVGSSGTFKVTPATSTGWTSITFNTYLVTQPQWATFLYVNNSVGWIVIGYGGGTLPTLQDLAGV